jgi:hypothetical protein
MNLTTLSREVSKHSNWIFDQIMDIWKGSKFSVGTFHFKHINMATTAEYQVIFSFQVQLLSRYVKMPKSAHNEGFYVHFTLFPLT